MLKYQGLSQKEVLKAREKFGFNEIKEEKESLWKEFFKKLVNPIVLMIEFALILAIIAKHWEDVIIISILLVINIGVDLIQSHKAKKSLKALKNNLAPRAMVYRDGKLIEIPARELVPRDIIELIIGDIIPADGKILEGEVEIDQSAITGESMSVEKKKDDEVFSSSIIKSGKAVVEITKIAEKTKIGESIELSQRASFEEESEFQKAVFKIGKFLIYLASILVIFVSAYLLYIGEPILETLRFGLVLAVASIPVALPAVLSVTMAIGAKFLSKKKALVTNFIAIEELAGVNKLCVDKTGTLTKNQMEIRNPKVYQNFSLKDLTTFGLLLLDPDGKRSETEDAIFEFGEKNNFLDEYQKFKIKEYFPFNPVEKKSEVWVERDGKESKILMGAPQVVLKKIFNKEEIEKDIKELAKKGFRSLVLAINQGGKWIGVGIFPILDPPRDDSKKVIEGLKKLGIDIEMITGDNSLIAKYISKILGIKKFFAEATPKDKYEIVSKYKEKGDYVAMTGDGVNDAPALRKANVGIAVSGATDAAKSSADLILLTPGLSVIEDAIKTAKEIFGRMQAYTTFRIAETIRIIFFISLSVILFDQSPLTAGMVILLALLNDIPVMAISYDNAPIENKPTRWNLRKTIFVATILGLTGLISSFTLLYWLKWSGFSWAIIQTIIFLKLDVSGHSTLYLTRTGERHFWEKPWPSLKFFLPAFGSRLIGTFIALFGILMEPISWKIILAIWAYSTFWFILNDYIKIGAYKFYDRFLDRK